jgi:hypothetical protein
MKGMSLIKPLAFSPFNIYTTYGKMYGNVSVHLEIGHRCCEVRSTPRSSGAVFCLEG